jgi:hypothetical protein
MQNNDGRLDAQQVSELLKEWQKQVIIANEKVENNIRSIEQIRGEIRSAIAELRDAKEIYSSSLKCYFATNWWKIYSFIFLWIPLFL